MNDRVANTLKRLGPCSSTDLVAALIKQHKLAPATARQWVSRSENIKKLANILLPRGARFVYLQSDYASPEFWHALVTCLLQNSIAYGGGLAALMAREGVMPVSHFLIACGAPVAQKRHVSASAVLERLKGANLVTTFDVPGIGECVELSQRTPASAPELARMRARLHTEGLLLYAIKDWARKLGLVSFNTVNVRDEGDTQPKVGTFNWDLAAPSYLSPLVQKTTIAIKPGFLVCDVLHGLNVSTEGLRPFLNKCQTLRSLPKIGKCLQLFVADGYSLDAFKAARTAGIVPATTETLFGVEVARALRQLADLLSETFVHDGTLQKVEEVFSRLSHIEGAANNLRGALFEYLVAEAVRTSSPHTSLYINEIVRDAQGKPAEVDVLLYHRDQSIRFIECKGYKPGGIVPDEMVEHWLKDRVPLMREAAQNDHYWRNCALEFEFWTSGQLSPKARALVQAKASAVRKFKLSVVEGAEVAERVKATNNTALKKTYAEHFAEHPLEKAEKATKRTKRALAIPPASRLPKRD